MAPPSNSCLGLERDRGERLAPWGYCHGSTDNFSRVRERQTTAEVVIAALFSCRTRNLGSSAGAGNPSLVANNLAWVMAFWQRLP